MGLPLLLDSIQKIRRRANPDLEVLGVLPTMHNARYSHNQEALEELRALEASGVRVFEPIARSTRFDRAAAEYRSTLEISPETPGAQSYYKLAEAIIRGSQTLHESR
jgi:chromosome partitioning protein